MNDVRDVMWCSINLSHGYIVHLLFVYLYIFQTQLRWRPMWDYRSTSTSVDCTHLAIDLSCATWLAKVSVCVCVVSGVQIELNFNRLCCHLHLICFVNVLQARMAKCTVPSIRRQANRWPSRYSKRLRTIWKRSKKSIWCCVIYRIIRICHRSLACSCAKASVSKTINYGLWWR